MTDAEAARLVRAVAATRRTRLGWSPASAPTTRPSAFSGHAKPSCRGGCTATGLPLLLEADSGRGGGPLRGGGRRHRATGDALRRPRTGIAMEAPTLVELAATTGSGRSKTPRATCSKPCPSWAARLWPTTAAFDELSLPYLASGATGLVSVVGNVAADRNAELIRAIRTGDLHSARAIQRSLIPLADTIMRTSQGAIMAKAALAALGSSRTRRCASRCSNRRSLTSSGFTDALATLTAAA